MFGVATDDEAPVALPVDAISGGLADVEYAQPGEVIAPLPPPAEPQILADAAIDPLPVGPPVAYPPAASDEVVIEPTIDEPAAETGGDMFSVDDLIDEPAVAGGDMFSVDDLIDEPDAVGQTQQPAPLPTPGPLPVPEMSATPEPLAMPAPLPTPEPLAMPAPLPTPEPLAVPELMATPEPLPTPEFSATPAPLPTPEPLGSPEPLGLPEPVAMPGPLASPEQSAMPEQSVAPASPAMPADSAALQPAQAPDLLGPHGVTESQAAIPTSDFAFTEPAPAEAAPDQRYDTGMFEPVVEPFAEMPPADRGESAPVFEPMANQAHDLAAEPTAEPDSVAEPELAQPEPASVVNPYAQESNEAEVIDPAMATGSNFDLPVAIDDESAAPREIVNPYAQESNEAQVIDPAMPLSESAPAEPESVPDAEHFDLYADAAAPAPTDESLEPSAEYAAADAANPDASYEQTQGVDPAMPPTYSGGSYGDNYGSYESPLPSTDRTTSVAPPGMENMAADGLVVAGSKRSSGKSKSKKTKRSKQDAGEALDIAALAAPSPEVAPPVLADGIAAPPAADYPYAPPIAGDQYAPPAVPAADTFGPVTPPFAEQQMPVEPAYQPPVAMPPAVPQVLAQPAKQGKSLADSLLGKVEPGQRHKFFGIPVGKPAPLPGAAQPEPPAPQLAPQPAPLAAPLIEGQYPAITEQPPVPTAAAPWAPPTSQAYAGADVFESVEATAYEHGKAKRGRKQKAPKPPKAAKAPKAPKASKPAKQGKSLADSLLGKVEPGQRHKFFGIPVGKPAPLPGAAQPVPPEPQLAPQPAPPAAPLIEGQYPAITEQPPVPTAAAPWAPPAPQAYAGADVFESVEATAYEHGKAKRGRKQKAPKQPKAAKAPKAPKASKPAKQGKSLADSLLGKVEPGQRHKFFGIPVGKPAPLPGAAQPVPPEPQPAPLAAPLAAPVIEGQYPAITEQPPAALAPAPVVPDAQPPMYQPPEWDEPPAQTAAPADVAAQWPPLATPAEAGYPPPPAYAPAAPPAPAPAPGSAPEQVFPEPVGPPANAPWEPAAAPDTMVAHAQNPFVNAQPDAVPAYDPSPQPPAPPLEAFPAPPPPAVEAFPAEPQPSSPQTYPAPPADPALPGGYVEMPRYDAEPAGPAQSPEPPVGAVATMQAAPSYLGGVAPATQQSTAFPGGYAPDFPAATDAGGGAMAMAAPATANPVADPRQLSATGQSGVVELAPGEAPVYRLVALPRRIVAQVIDSAIVAGLAVLLTILLGVNQANVDGVMTIAGVRVTQIAVVIVAVTIYQAGLIAYNRGQTIGKRLLKIRVMREDGKRMDLVYGILRETLIKTVLVVVTLGLFGIADVVWPLIDKQNRALHDVIVKSRVVEDRPA